MKRTIGWLLGLVVLLAGSGVSAQETEAQREFDAQALEALELRVDVDRDLEGAARELEAAVGGLLEEVAGGATEARRVEAEELLVRTRLLWARVLLDLGRAEEASAALGPVDPDALSGEARRALEALVQRVQEARSERPGADRVEEMTNAYLAIGDLDAIRELGALAAPTLARAVEEHLDSFPPSAEKDPLVLLDQLDRAESTRLVARHLEGSSYLFKRRLLRVMGMNKILINNSYLDSDVYPRPTRFPEWMHVIEAAAEEPALFAETKPFLMSILGWGACMPRLRDTLLEALHENDPRFDDARSMLRSVRRFWEDARPILAVALASPDPDLRWIAVQAWSKSFEEREPFLALVHDPEPRIRRLLPGSVGRWPGPTGLRLLEELAGDPEAEVRAEVGKALRNIELTEETVAAVLPAFDAFYRGDERPAAERRDLLELAGQVNTFDVGLVHVARLALERQDGSLLETTAVDRVLPLLPADLVAPYVDALYRTRPPLLRRIVLHWDPRSSYYPADRMEALEALALRPGLDAELVLILGLASPQALQPELLPVLRTALTDPRWTHESLQGVDYMVGTMAERLPGQTLSELLTPLLRDRSLPDDLYFWMVHALDYRAPGGSEAARAVIERWEDADYDSNRWKAADEAIQALGRVTFEGSDELLRRLAREGRHLWSVPKAMGERRDASFVPDLVSLLHQTRPDWKSPVNGNALTALCGYMTDEAAEALLDLAAEASEQDVRTQCLSAVEQIRQYQDARARWERRALERTTSRETAQELLELLDTGNEAQRAAAVRGLAALGALETLPRLIRLLSDPSEVVRAAARAAVDHLTKLEEPGGDD